MFRIHNKPTALLLSALIAVSPILHQQEADAKGIVTATVKCQKVENKGGASVGYIYGKGSGSNKGEAIRNAKKNVQVPQGYYKRHCHPIE